MGRRALSETLQLNDGIVRGLLERLAASKMALVTVKGVQLSKMGKESLRKLLRQLSIKKIISIDQSDLVSANSVMGVHATKLYRPGMTGIVQRVEPTDKDLIIIGFGKDPGRALAGALAAVLSLQKA